MRAQERLPLREDAMAWFKCLFAGVIGLVPVALLYAFPS